MTLLTPFCTSLSLFRRGGDTKDIKGGSRASQQQCRINLQVKLVFVIEGGPVNTFICHLAKGATPFFHFAAPAKDFKARHQRLRRSINRSI